MILLHTTNHKFMAYSMPWANQNYHKSSWGFPSFMGSLFLYRTLESFPIVTTMRLVFVGWQIWFPAFRPSILNEAFRGFPQSLQSNPLTSI